MNRRTFMRYGIAAGATVAVSAPADLFASLKPQTAPDFGAPHDEFVALTQALERLSHCELHTQMGAIHATASDRDLERSCRAGLSLLMVGASLSAANDASAGRTTPISEMKPPVSDVMLGVVPELGRSFSHLLGLLDTVTPQHVTGLRARLTADKRPLEQVRTQLSETFRGLGVSSRRHRRLMRHVDDAVETILGQDPERFLSTLLKQRSHILDTLENRSHPDIEAALTDVRRMRQRPEVQRLASSLRKATAKGTVESAADDDASDASKQGQGAIGAVEMDPEKWASQRVPNTRSFRNMDGEIFMAVGGVMELLGLLMFIAMMRSIRAMLLGGWFMGLFVAIGVELTSFVPMAIVLSVFGLLLIVEGIQLEMNSL